MSHLEASVNKLVIFIILVQTSICAIWAGLNFLWGTTQTFDNIVLEPKNQEYEESILNFFTYWLLMNTLLPISLQVTLEVVKVV